MEAVGRRGTIAADAVEHHEKVGLVGRLAFGGAHVAVDPGHAVRGFGVGPADLRVEAGRCVDQESGYVDEVRLSPLVSVPMLFEPLPLIVGRDAPQEVEGVLLDHGLMLLGTSKGTISSYSTTEEAARLESGRVEGRGRTWGLIRPCPIAAGGSALPTLLLGRCIGCGPALSAWNRQRVGSGTSCIPSGHTGAATFGIRTRPRRRSDTGTSMGFGPSGHGSITNDAREAARYPTSPSTASRGAGTPISSISVSLSSDGRVNARASVQSCNIGLPMPFERPDPPCPPSSGSAWSSRPGGGTTICPGGLGKAPSSSPFNVCAWSRDGSRASYRRTGSRRQTKAA